jgi:hypothetical protein
MACLIQDSVVDAHLKVLIRLGDDERIGQPHGVVDLHDKASVQQLSNLFTEEVLSLDRLLSRLLTHWLGIRVDLNMVLDHLPGDPRSL